MCAGRKYLNKRLLGNILLIITAVIWGLAFAFQREGMEHIGPMTFTAARMTLAAAAIWTLSLFWKNRAADTDPAEKAEMRRNTWTGGLGCGIFLTFASLFQQTGIIYTSAGKAGFITAFYILLVPVINFLIFKKRSTWLVWLAVLLGLIGMYLLCMTESFRLSYGDALVCVCAVLFSGHILWCDHYVKRADPIRMAAIQLLVVSVISWIAAFLFETPSLADMKAALIPILYCGLASCGIGYTLQIVAQKFTEPAVASLLMSLESVFAVIGGVVLLNERMSTGELAGCVIMFAAIIIVQIPVPSFALQKKKQEKD